MNKKGFRIWEVIACLSTSIIAIVCISRFTPDLKGEVAAAWVQAIGSIAAIGAAIWISHDQDRVRRDESLNVARITARAILMRLDYFIGELYVVGESLDNLAKGQGEAWDFEYSLEVIESHPVFELRDLVSLMPLGNDCAFKIAGAVDQLNAIRCSLKLIVATPSLAATVEKRKEHAKFLVSYLKQASELLDEARRAMLTVIQGVSSY